MARQSNRTLAHRSTQGVLPQATPQPSPSSIALRLAPVCTAVLIGIGVHMGAGLLTQTSGMAHAQTASLGDNTARSYNIPAGSLGTSLASFASQSGFLLSFDPALTSGLSAPALSGNHTVRGGLERLLAGSGLEVETRGDGSYALRRAPQPASSEVATLPEVVVTASPSELTEGSGSYTSAGTSAATGLNLSLRETPQSVSVMTNKRIEDQQLKSIACVLEQTVGINTASDGAPSGGVTSVYARGFGVRNVQVDGVQTPVEGFGESTSYAFGALDTAIYDSVTVVRGATGLMTGAGLPSASINLTRKRPTQDLQTSMEVGLGRWDHRRLVGDIGGPLNSTGSLRGRLVGAYDESGSWISRYDSSRHIVYGVIEADIGEKTLFTAAFEHGNEDSNNARQDGYPVYFSDGTASNFSRADGRFVTWGKYSQKKRGFSVGLDHEFNENWMAKLNYSHNRNDMYQRRGVFGSAIDPDFYVSDIHNMINPTDTKIDVFDLKVNGLYELFGRQHQVAMGFNRTINDASVSIINNFVDGAYIVDGVPLISEPDWSSETLIPQQLKSQQNGFFLSTKIQASDNLSVILGNRWSSWKRRYEILPFTLIPDGRVTDDRKHSSISTAYIGAVYDLTSDVSVYGSYAEIFNPQNYKNSAGNLLDPETGKNYEI